MQHYQHHQPNKYNNHNNPRGDSESNINHVLLITVINPHYPITCDLIHQICSSYGKVNRIVIFRKNGVQAMVEFDNIEAAKRAKTMLNGCDIYTGCCTLRIEYAKPTRLNIHKNDNDSFDYTNPNLSSPSEQGQQASGLNQQQQQQQDQQQQQQQHLQTPSGTGNSAHQSMHHSPHGSQHGQAAHGHHQRAGRGAGASSASRNSGHEQHHFHSSHHHHNPQSGNPQQQNVHGQVQPPPVTAASAYSMNSQLDQSANSADTFHQDGGFNVGRGGPPYVGVDSPYMSGHGGGGGGGGGHGLHGNMYSRQDGHHHHTRGGHNHNSSYSSANATNALMGTHSNLVSSQGTVMMVYGLQPERVNCDRLFNLFCLYGNVVRVKFLRTKEGCAMVQMGDVLAVNRCFTELSKITLFGSELQISYSKQAFLHDAIQPFPLPDGSPSFKDFTCDKNNRFKNPELASKNRILPPSPVLHFFNAPFGITEDELILLFKQTADREPVSVKIFTPKADNSKSFSGLVTFKDSTEATEALVMCNHLTMPKVGASHPYILRLCFSPPTYARSSQTSAPYASAPGNGSGGGGSGSGSGSGSGGSGDPGSQC